MLGNGPRVHVKLEGLKEMQDNLRGLAKEYPALVLRALYHEGEYIMTDAKNHYVPVRDGHLRNSGHVVVSQLPAIMITLGFGGPAGIGTGFKTNVKAVGYAVIQHENTDYAHKVGQCKYLERPMNAAIPSMAKNVGERVHVDKLLRDPRTAKFVKRA